MDDGAESSMNLEEEESCWVPLVEETTAQNTQTQAQATLPAIPDSARGALPSAPQNNRPRRRESLQVISTRLDSRRRLKVGLVEHPLDQAWRLFLQHFCREIWNLEIPLQLGIVLVMIGTVLLMLTWALSFQWLNIQTIVLLVLFGVSFYYLAPPDVEQKLQNFFRLLLNPEKAFELADYADPAILRRLFIGLLLIPAFLELRTFGFLSEATAESSFKSNLSVGFLVGVYIAYQYKLQTATPRQCIQRGIYVLYGCAFFCSLWRVDVRRLPALAGPFFVATGTLLLSSRDEDMNWLSRVLRHALRLTLRDVLASVGESVREDEMLQLAMLRWLVDFWASSPSASSPPNPASGSTESQVSTTDIVTSRNPRSYQAVTQHHDLQWGELQSMLEMTTDQMTEEVPAHRASTTSGQSSTSQPNESWTADSAREDNDSLRNLHNLLHTLDVDDRARPAVMTYKRVVESFPPTRSHAVFISIIRRCPAMLMLLYRYVTGSNLALATTATLLPFAVMEGFRVLHWAEACQRELESGVGSTARDAVTDREAKAPLISLPVDMDPMCIILSGDHYRPTHPPPLLQVWINICSSVHALETGLTAARCVQTTAVAADFAGNIISLAQFGVEVTQFGWMHGITVLARELMHIHATQSTREARYTSAAVNAVRNGQIVARNVRALSGEDDGNPVFDPLVGVLAAIVGRGWLWGKEEAERQGSTVASTVTIEELPPDEAPGKAKERKALEKGMTIDGEASGEEYRLEQLSGGTASEREVEVISGACKDIQSHDESAKLSTEQATFGDESTLSDSVTKNDESPAKEEKFAPSDSDSRPPQLERSGDETEQDLSELMGLIADAFEKGLIVESEKNAFVETLIDSPSGSTVDQMEKTLRELLETSQNEPCGKQEHVVPVINPEEGDAGEPLTASKNFESSAKEHAADSDEWRPLSPQSHEVSDAAPELTTNQQSSGVVGRSTESSIGTPDLQADGATSVQRDASRQEGKNDELLKWIGGSLAVIGAVAGGIAIANNASQHEKDDSARQQNVANHGTVYIEELDDSDDNAEWVDVAVSDRDN